MNKKLLLLLLLIAGPNILKAVPVWSTDIAPIIYNKCASCHHTGNVAPFNLMTYADCVSHSATIRTKCANKTMPPWPPDPAYSRLAHERRLTDAEINKIKDWVDGGTPSGDLAQAPPPPVFNNNGDLPGTADLTVQAPVFTSTADTADVYQCFVIPSGLLTEKFITAFEAIPGNRNIVHHVLVYADTTGACAALDAASPGPGYVNFGGVGTDAAIMLGGWVPGGAPMQYPNNFGVRIPPNADIVLQIHYPAGTMGDKDSTKIRFFFAQNAVRNAYIVPVLNHVDPTVISPYPLSIAANTTATYTEHYTSLALPTSLLGVAPHMHLIGKSIKAFAVSPATQDTQKIISIPNWDFHWQGFYMLPRIVKIDGSSDIYGSAFYDNTSNNALNPNNPPQTVTAGEQTTDEMMIVYFVFALYQPGDENIIIDSNVALNTSNYYRGQQLFTPYPNPASGQIFVKYYFDKDNACSISLLGIDGRTVKQFALNTAVKSGYHADNYSVADVPAGIYTLQLKTAQQVLTEKVIIQH